MVPTKLAPRTRLPRLRGVPVRSGPTSDSSFEAPTPITCTSSIDVSSIVRGLLLDKMRTTVLTSATLTVDGGFSYIRDRLGIHTAGEIRLPSEFNFERQALLYLPPRMPDPRSQEFAGAAGRQVVEIL